MANVLQFFEKNEHQLITIGQNYRIENILTVICNLSDRLFIHKFTHALSP